MPFLLTGQLYITGGVTDSHASLRTVDVVDIASNIVSQAPLMGMSRADHTMTASPSNLFVFGGSNEYVRGRAMASCEVFSRQAMR